MEDTNNNINNDNIIEKTKIVDIPIIKKRIKNKETVFEKERKVILEGIIALVGTHFYSHEIDANHELQTKILALDGDIRKYFSVSNWGAYKPNFSVSKRPLSIIRSVLKDMKIKYKSRPDIIRSENKQTTTTEYTVEYNK
ncbi:MAG: hypothetical protein PHX99_06455 [Synergistaceae bacterium]|nr:hypothetical protein [Synergistaceae bacterium]